MTLLLALFLVVSPVEQSYGPYTRPTNGGDAAVAPARGGALLAWSEENRIHVGLLDTRAQLSPDIHTLPARSARAVAVAPAAASDGNTFFVVWTELEGSLRRTVGMVIARDGTPVGEPRLYDRPLPIESNEFGVRLVWDGSAYRLWGGEKLSTIAPNGDVVSTVTASAIPSGAAAANGVIATSSTAIRVVGCGFSWCTWASYVTWAVGSKDDSVQVGFFTGSHGQPVNALPLPPTAMANAGDRFVVAWPTRDDVQYLVTGNGAARVSASPDTSVRPGIACDETQCVLAYGQSRDVRAFVFPVDRLRGPELLTIAATERNERAPQVYTLGTDRFLVVYRSDGHDGARLNWRVVSQGTDKRRAIRGIP